MSATNTRVIKGRINSVKNTKKITKAMEMIAAAKMRKSIDLTMATKDFVRLAKEVSQVLKGGKIQHKLARKHKGADKDLIVIITSNRGLCGGYNAKVLSKVAEMVEGKTDQYKVITVGNKALRFVKSRGLELIAHYDKFLDNPQFEEVTPLSRDISRRFAKGEFKSVSIVFTEFINTLTQTVKVKQLLPLNSAMIKKIAFSLEAEDIANSDTDDKTDKPEPEYDFEPGKKALVDYFVPILIDLLTYQSLIEASSSEHSSRMVAMKNATDSATDMIDELTLEYNKSRQAKVTQEISEIVAGSLAI